MTNADHYDWKVVKIKGYNAAKRSIQATAINSIDIIDIEEKSGVSTSWFELLSNQKLKSYAPPGSVVAVYSLRGSDSQKSYIAGWAKSITKNPEAEKLIVSPFTILPFVAQSRTSQPIVYGNVLDSEVKKIASISDAKEMILSILNKSNDEYKLRGDRGFMIRSISVNEDESSNEFSWQFIPRWDRTQNNDERWGNLFDSKINGAQADKLTSTLKYASKSLSSSEIELIGLTRVELPTYNNIDNAEKLIKTPNYITDGKNNNTRFAFSITALAVDKKTGRVKQHVALPLKKIDNCPHAYIGAHNTKMNAVNQSRINHNLQQTKEKPLLRLAMNSNRNGPSKTFSVISGSEDILKHKERIEQALPGFTPLFVDTDKRYLFRIGDIENVKAQLYDLLNTKPIFTKEYRLGGEQYYRLEGRLNDPGLSGYISKIINSTPHEIINGKEAFKAADLALLTSAIDKTPYKIVDTLDNAFSSSTSTKQTPAVKAKITMAEWQKEKYGNNPYNIVTAYASELVALAKEYRLDGDDILNKMQFTEDPKGVLIKKINGSHGSDNGSRAIRCNMKYEANAKGHEYVSVSITMFNKSLNRDENLVFNPYSYLRDEYLRDTTGGKVDYKVSDEHKAKLAANAERRAQEALKIAEEKAIEKEKDWSFWLSKYQRAETISDISDAPKYFKDKGIPEAAISKEIRSGDSSTLGKFTYIPYGTFEEKITGLQRILDNKIRSENGKLTNKISARGSEPSGAFNIIGDIDSSSKIYYFEGYADAYTAHKITGQAAVFCVVISNYEKNIPLFQERYPDKEHIIVHDHDIYNREKGNPGLMAGLLAAYETKSQLLTPDLLLVEGNSKPKDINDIYIELLKTNNIDALKNNLNQYSTVPSDPLSLMQAWIQHAGTDAKYLEPALNKAISWLEDNNTSKQRLDKDLLRNHLKLCHEKYTNGHDELGRHTNNNLASFDVYQKKTTQKKNDEISPASATNSPIQINEVLNTKKNKTYLLIKSESYADKKYIEDRLSAIFNDGNLIYNEKLDGYIAPLQLKRIIGTALAEKTGHPKLYLSKHNGSTVVKGYYYDGSLREMVRLKLSNIDTRYSESIPGYLINDDKQLPLVKELLSEFLSPTYVIDEQYQNNINTDIEKVNHLSALVNLPANTISSTHVSLLTENDNPMFKADDYTFSAFYALAKSKMGASNIHPPALAWEACKLSKEHDLDTSEKETMALHEKLCLLNAQIASENVQISKFQSIFDETFEKASLSEAYREDVSSIFSQLAGKTSTTPELKSIYESIIKTINLEAIAIDNGNVVDAAIINADEDAGFEESNIPSHEKLLSDVTVMLTNGYSAEEIYEDYLKNAYSNSDGSLDNARLKNDLQSLSKNEIPGEWTATPVASFGKLCSIINKTHATNRLGFLQDLCIELFSKKPNITLQTLRNNISGSTRPRPNNPYVKNGVYDDDLLNRDLVENTPYTNIRQVFNAVSKMIKSGETVTLFPDVPKQGLNNESAQGGKDKKEIITQEQDRSPVNKSEDFIAKIVWYANNGIEINNIDNEPVKKWLMEKENDRALQIYTNILQEKNVTIANAKNITSTNPANDININELKGIMSDAVGSAIPFSVFNQEWFAKDGYHINDNPYYANTKINRQALLNDLSSLGLKSVSQLYNSVLSDHISELLYDRKASPFMRIHENNGDGFGDKYIDINELFSSDTITTPLPIMPFRRWVKGETLHLVDHKILGVDLLSDDATTKLSAYSENEHLFLADVMGVLNASAGDENIIDALCKHARARHALEALPTDSLSSINAEELQLYCIDLGIPPKSSADELSKQITAHLDTLKTLRASRLSQYSYIQNVIINERAGEKVPEYVTDEIDLIKSSEQIFNSAVLNKLKEEVASHQYLKVDTAIDLVSKTSTAEKLFSQALEPFTYVKHGERYTPKQIKDDHIKVNYDYRYKILDRPSLREPTNLLKGINSYAIIPGNVIATTVPLDEKELNAINASPVNPAAIAHALSPISNILDMQHHCYFDTDQGYKIIRKNGNLVDCYSMDNHDGEYKIQKEGRYKTPEDYLKQNGIHIVSSLREEHLYNHVFNSTHKNIIHNVNVVDSIQTLPINHINDHVKLLKNIPLFKDIYDLHVKDKEKYDIGTIVSDLKNKIYDVQINNINDEKHEQINRYVENISETSSNMNELPIISEMTPQVAQAYIKSFISEDPSIKFYYNKTIEKMDAGELSKLKADIISGEFESVEHYIHAVAVNEDRHSNEKTNAIYNKYYQESPDLINPSNKIPDKNQTNIPSHYFTEYKDKSMNNVIYARNDIPATSQNNDTLTVIPLYRFETIKSFDYINTAEQIVECSESHDIHKKILAASALSILNTSLPDLINDIERNAGMKLYYVLNDAGTVELEYKPIVTPAILGGERSDEFIYKIISAADEFNIPESHCLAKICEGKIMFGRLVNGASSGDSHLNVEINESGMPTEVQWESEGTIVYDENRILTGTLNDIKAGQLSDNMNYANEIEASIRKHNILDALQLAYLIERDKGLDVQQEISIDAHENNNSTQIEIGLSSP